MYVCFIIARAEVFRSWTILLHFVCLKLILKCQNSFECFTTLWMTSIFQGPSIKSSENHFAEPHSKNSRGKKVKILWHILFLDMLEGWGGSTFWNKNSKVIYGWSLWGISKIVLNCYYLDNERIFVFHNLMQLMIWLQVCT